MSWKISSLFSWFLQEWQPIKKQNKHFFPLYLLKMCMYWLSNMRNWLISLHFMKVSNSIETKSDYRFKKSWVCSDDIARCNEPVLYTLKVSNFPSSLNHNWTASFLTRQGILSSWRKLQQVWSLWYHFLQPLSTPGTPQINHLRVFPVSVSQIDYSQIDETPVFWWSALCSCSWWGPAIPGISSSPPPPGRVLNYRHVEPRAWAFSLGIYSSNIYPHFSASRCNFLGTTSCVPLSRRVPHSSTSAVP